MSNSLWSHRLQYARLFCSLLSPEFAQIHVHWVSDAIQPSNLLLHPSPFAFNLSEHRGVFQWAGSLHQVAFGFSFSNSLFNEYSGFISFMTDWFDLLAVQGTLKSLLLHHNLKASILCCSAFFMVSHLYMTTGKSTIALTIWTFVCKVISLLFNALSRFVIAFLPGSKRLLITWLQSLSTVILEPKKIKVAQMVRKLPAMQKTQVWSLGQKSHLEKAMATHSSILA